MAKGLDSTPHAAAGKIKTTHQTIKTKIKLRRKYCRLLCLTFHVKNPKALSLIVSSLMYYISSYWDNFFFTPRPFYFFWKSTKLELKIFWDRNPRNRNNGVPIHSCCSVFNSVSGFPPNKSRGFQFLVQ